MKEWKDNGMEASDFFKGVAISLLISALFWGALIVIIM